MITKSPARADPHKTEKADGEPPAFLRIEARVLKIILRINRKLSVSLSDKIFKNTLKMLFG